MRLRALIVGSALGFAAPAAAQDVLVVGTWGGLREELDDLNLVKDMLANTGEFASVDAYDAASGTPPTALLLNYHAILVYSEQGVPFSEPLVLGDRLAEAVDEGHGVVVASGAIQTGTAVEGRFAAEYMPVTVGNRVELIELQEVHQAPGYEWLVGPIEGHWSVYGLNMLNSGPTLTRANGIAPWLDSDVTAVWDDGTAAVVVREPLDQADGRTAAINLNHLRFGEPVQPGTHGNGWAGRNFAIDGDRAFSSTLLWVMRYTKPFEAWKNEDVFQDLDCDGSDVLNLEETKPVDVLDPVCAARIDPATGQPFPLDDWYYDYASNGCDVWLGADDLDGDQLVGFVPTILITDPITGVTRSVGQPVVLSPDGTVSSTSTLVCDNCPLDFNPDQYDIDQDSRGDLCDNCPYTPNPDQLNGQACPFEGPWPVGDGIGDACDNCPCRYNPDQDDGDIDAVGDLCDNCPVNFNSDQADSDPDPLTQLFDGWGDACDNCPQIFNPGQGDVDFDQVGDVCDNCGLFPNSDQSDQDNDKVGDACDLCPLDPLADDDEPDLDEDRVGDSCDNCLAVPNPDQVDADLDGFGDACDTCPTFSNAVQTDGDGDLVGDICDVCPAIADPTQKDVDGDRIGDACDGCPTTADGGIPDSDGDAVSDACDLCLLTPSFGNVDRDGDKVGDECDNCPEDLNPYQEDADADGSGDLCDAYILRGGGEVGPGCAVAPGAVGWLGLVGLAALVRRRRGA